MTPKLKQDNTPVSKFHTLNKCQLQDNAWSVSVSQMQSYPTYTLVFLYVQTYLETILLY